VAKTDKAYHCLVRQFSERKTGKVYDALVGGHPRLPKGEVSLPIGRHPKIRVKMAVVEKRGQARSDGMENTACLPGGLCVVGMQDTNGAYSSNPRTSFIAESSLGGRCHLWLQSQ
jgi:hypothetical protein